ncbi:hypothetical protein AAG906_039110 [Vitis piasezkii]
MKTKRKTEAQTTPFHGPNLHPHPHPEHNDDGGAQHEEDETTPYQEAQQDEEVEEEEEEEEEEEVEEGRGGEGKGREGEQSERPKLDDGFYEIEAIRRRRVRKGQLQYLIKWRGWPENANTWEPLENLQACSDVIDAFEDRLRSKRNRSSRKRKRKSGGSAQTLPKKKQQRSGASNVRGVHFRINDEHLLSTHVNTLGHADIEGVNGAVNNVEMTKESNENGSGDVSLQIPQREEDNDSDPKLIELRGSNEGNANKFKIQFQEVKALEGDCPMNGHSKVERVEMDQSSRRTGARRRKSGSVKRFTKDLAPCEPNDIQNTATRIQIGSCGRVESPEFPGNDSGLNNKFDGAINMSAITEIIKPISYSASISNDAQDVSVTFMAMRSDGKEVMVDNKFLKANNPLLLINFYEQHLRYSPTT